MYQKGFTLIELLVVVLIIGILSAVALPQYTKAVEKSRAAEMMTFMSSAKKAVSLWVLQNGGIPTVKTELLKSESLDIDLASPLDCEGSYAGDCGSKNFSYSVFCNNGKCTVQFYRNDSSSGHYYKGYVYTRDGNNWKVYCTYESDLGKTICNSLVTMGEVDSIGPM